jgi:hypothetical protein
MEIWRRTPPHHYVGERRDSLALNLSDERIDNVAGTIVGLMGDENRKIHAVSPQHTH